MNMHALQHKFKAADYTSSKVLGGCRVFPIMFFSSSTALVFKLVMHIGPDSDHIPSTYIIVQQKREWPPGPPRSFL